MSETQDLPTGDPVWARLQTRRLLRGLCPECEERLVVAECTPAKRLMRICKGCGWEEVSSAG